MTVCDASNRPCNISVIPLSTLEANRLRKDRMSWKEHNQMNAVPPAHIPSTQKKFFTRKFGYSLVEKRNFRQGENKAFP